MPFFFARGRFNTQPPEGGWASGKLWYLTLVRFNTQPPEGGWTGLMLDLCGDDVFQHTAA